MTQLSPGLFQSSDCYKLPLGTRWPTCDATPLFVLSLFHTSILNRVVLRTGRDGFHFPCPASGSAWNPGSSDCRARAQRHYPLCHRNYEKQNKNASPGIYRVIFHLSWGCSRASGSSTAGISEQGWSLGATRYSPAEALRAPGRCHHRRDPRCPPRWEIPPMNSIY